MNSEKDNRIRNLAKNLVKQTIKSITNSGIVKTAKNEIVKVNIHDKEQLKAAVELRIIKPFMNNSNAQYSLESKKQIQELIKIYDEIFEEEYANYLKERERPKFDVIDGQRNSSSGRIGRLKNKYNTVNERKEREITLDMYYGDSKAGHIQEDLAK